MSEPSSRRLVLCFDGTSKKFRGRETDTNIVKIYEMLDRRAPDQYHYYQPGIGSYVQGQISNFSIGNIFTRLKNFVYEATDAGFGTSFVHHVLAGYTFLMRFYKPGDKIFIFGFSRGAYTARFLAEMVFNIGLLSQGNEEMIKFAWSTFSDFQHTRGEDDKFRDFMHRFKDTFCREHITVHFLGLFDCVNSVSQFQIPLLTRKASPYIPMPPATHIRHAVSIHERRLRFKPALFLMDPTAASKSDIKEVYFAGNHGDVGGGWHCQGAKYLLSDIPLKWMVEEVLSLPDTENVLAWQKTKVDHMEQHEDKLESVIALKRILMDLKKAKANPISRLIHDPLAFGHGASFFGVLSWWIVECLPIAHYDLKDGKWTPRYWPPNLGSRRDIPLNAAIHPSVVQMKRAGIIDARNMPRLGGEEPYDPIQRLNIFSWFRRKPARGEPERDYFDDSADDEEEENAEEHTNGVVGEASNGTANGMNGASETNGGTNETVAGGKSRKWNFDRVTQSGSKSWSLI